MSIYKISFKQLQQQPYISEMLTALEKGLNKYNIDFYLVGAVARDVWMTAINDIPPSRVTGDIDFAVFINDKIRMRISENISSMWKDLSPTKAMALYLNGKISYK